MICIACGEDKEDELFAWKRKSTEERSTKCRDCHKVYAKKHYTENKERYLDSARRSRRAIHLRNKRYMVEYLKDHPCIDCGESDIQVLQFDHIVPLNNNKAPRVTSLVDVPIARVQEEIDKCEVRCANCHVRRTRMQLGRVRV